MGKIRTVFDHVFCKVEFNKSPVEREFVWEITNGIFIEVNDLDHFEFESVNIQGGDFVVFESDELNIREVADFLRHLFDLIVGGVDFGDGKTLPPVLVVEVDVVDVEKLTGNLLDFLADIVEGACLQGPLDGVDEGFFLDHFEGLNF